MLMSISSYESAVPLLFLRVIAMVKCLVLLLLFIGSSHGVRVVSIEIWRVDIASCFRRACGLLWALGEPYE
jgi:hypothetical protein